MVIISEGLGGAEERNKKEEEGERQGLKEETAK